MNFRHVQYLGYPPAFKKHAKTPHMKQTALIEEDIGLLFLIKKNQPMAHPIHFDIQAVIKEK